MANDDGSAGSRARRALRTGATALRTGVIGTAGGAAFFLLALPLPWMLGAMAASAVATVGGVPLRIDDRLRRTMFAILGVMVGGTFTPEVVAHAVRWPATMAVLVVFVIGATAISWLVYRRLGGLDARSAVFAGTPGGLNEMVILTESVGGNVRGVALAQSTRIFVVVMTLPFVLRLIFGIQPSDRLVPAAPLWGVFDLVDVVLIAAAAGAGMWLARTIRIPAWQLTGAMFGSAVVHATGLSDAIPPGLLIAAAQVVIGISVGARFLGLTLRELGRALALGALASAGMLAFAAALALLLAPLVDIPFASILLAYAPGGVTEMSLVALALGLDVAFVATHHVIRILLIVMAGPIFFRRLGAHREQ
ncbi:MAG: AbrB family transcriptional regulator [Alphaproteobacteria bacterium]